METAVLTPEVDTEPALDTAAAPEGPEARTEADDDDDLLVEEIRIEDLSIDGMCGVY